MVEMTDHKLVLAVITIISLTILGLCAMLKGFDGLLLTTIIGIISAITSGLLGFKIGLNKTSD